MTLFLFVVIVGTVGVDVLLVALSHAPLAAGVVTVVAYVILMGLDSARRAGRVSPLTTAVCSWPVRLAYAALLIAWSPYPLAAAVITVLSIALSVGHEFGETEAMGRRD